MKPIESDEPTSTATKANVARNDMKSALYPPASSRASFTPESLAVEAWYAAHSNVRRLWAVKDAHGLRIIVSLEPALDSNDIYPAWIANRHLWAHELRSCTDNPSVRLEQIGDLVFDETAIDAEGVIVATLSWRDPSVI